MLYGLPEGGVASRPSGRAVSRASRCQARRKAEQKRERQSPLTTVFINDPAAVMCRAKGEGSIRIRVPGRAKRLGRALWESHHESPELARSSITDMSSVTVLKSAQVAEGRNVDSASETRYSPLPVGRQCALVCRFGRMSATQLHKKEVARS
jgi:hypothetical protein